MPAAPFRVESLQVGPFGTNCYVLACNATGKAAIIDPGDDGDRIADTARSLGVEVTRLLLTHAHLDHVSGLQRLRRWTEAPIHLHPDDMDLYVHVPEQARAFGLAAGGAMPEVGVEVSDGQTLDVGALRVKVMHTPGHSPGGVCYYVAGAPGTVFVGDVLFAGSIGRTDLWRGSMDTLMRSIGRTLMSLPDDVRVLNGHGPATTIGRERASNPYRGWFVSE